MARFPLFGVDQRGKSKRWTAQRRVNVFAEIAKEGDRSKMGFFGTPGLSLFAALGDTPVRGLYTMNELLYAVHRGTLYEINNAGTATSRGTLSTTSGKVDMTDNGSQLYIADGSTRGYTYTPASTTFAAVADADCPTTDTCAFQGTYIIVNSSGTGRFYLSASNDATSWDALDFATAEGSPDDLVRVFVDRGDLMLFGSRTTEFWANVGASDFPFSRIAGAVVEWGLAARWSVAKMDNTVVFLGKNRTGEAQVVQLAGYAPTPISDPAMEGVINDYSTLSDATAFAYRIGGHTFYEINFPTAGASWLFDATTGLWSELSSGSEGGRHRAELGADFVNKAIVSDYENGNLYRLDLDVYTDNGTEIQRELVSRHIFGEQHVSIARLWLDCETGNGVVSGQGSEPVMMLSVSKDGGRTFGNERTATLGALGQYSARPIWRRLGAAYEHTLKFRQSDPVPFRVLGGWVDAAA